jgi:hypothetical protein
VTINIGDIVASTYRARWTGVVLGRACDLTDDGCLCHRGRGHDAVLVIRMTRDRNDNPPRKPMSKRHLHVLDQAWLRKVMR